MATAPQLLAWPCPHRLRPCQPLPQPGPHRCPAPQHPSFGPSTSFQLAKRPHHWLRLMTHQPQELSEGDAGAPAKGCVLVPKQPWRHLSWRLERGNLLRVPQAGPLPTPRRPAGCSQGQRKDLRDQSWLLSQGCQASRNIPGPWVQRVK